MMTLGFLALAVLGRLAAGEQDSPIAPPQMTFKNALLFIVIFP